MSMNAFVGGEKRKVIPIHDDHRPVEVYKARESRNLLPVKDFPYSFISGITYTPNSDGTFSVAGTPTARVNVVLNNRVDNDNFTDRLHLEAGTYTISRSWTGVPNIIVFDNNAQNLFVLSLSQKQGSFTLSEGMDVFVHVRTNANETANLTNAYVQIERGSVAHPYEPYGTVTDTIFTPAVSEQTGKVLEFTNSYNSEAEVEVAGKSEQVQLTGKNLFSVVTGTTVGITLTKNPDGSYHASGTATQAAFFRHTGISKNEWLTNPVLVPDGDTMWTFNTRGTITGGNVFMRCRPTSGVFGTFNITSNTSRDYHAKIAVSDVRCMEFCVAAGTTVDLDVYMQIEVGSKFTDFEPYVGGIPSPNPDYPQPITSIDSVGLVSRGRNLLPNKYANPVSSVGTHTRNGLTFTVYDDGSIQVDGTATVSSDLDLFYGGSEQYEFAQVKAGDKIYVSNMGGGVGITVAVRTGESTRTSRVQTYDKGYFTAAYDGGLQAWLIYQAGTEIHTLVKPMVNIGNDYAPYEPYHSTTRTIDLQGNQLRSLPDGTKDELLVHRDGRVQLVQRAGFQIANGENLNGWPALMYVHGTTGFYEAYSTVAFADGTAKADGSGINMRSNVTTQNRTTDRLALTLNANMVNNSLYWRIPDKTAERLSLTSAAACRAFLTKTPMEILYPLKEPQTITLPSIDPLPTYWPTTVIYDQDGNDISAFVRVIE